jgi:CDP-glucose 4,6-dehydratase
VRNKIATRPWQHVLEPLSGYLWIGASLGLQSEQADPRVELLCGAFNFGPALTSNRTVAQLVQELLKHTGGDWTDASDPHARHEASKLNLATDKAFHLLGWQPLWNFETTIQRTAEWYLAEYRKGDPKELTQRQILAYQESAIASGLSWSMT